MRSHVVLAAMLFVAAPAKAAPPGARDPDWPCQQIKVPQLSLASIWSGPPLDEQTAWQQDQDVASAVHRLVQRRVPVAQAQDEIRSFAEQEGDQKRQKLQALAVGLFSVLNAEREAVIAGLDRFGRRQKQLAEAVRADNAKLRALQADAGSDSGETSRMADQVTWEARVFDERRQALSYVCDVPARIEQRLFALAKTIQRQLE
jgi:hypothetical protein